jgi:hypothetical protein
MLDLVLLAASTAAQPAGEPPLREYRGAQLYAVDPATEQRYPTATVPYRPGAICYEWVAFFAPEARTLTVREEVELPAAPASWGDAPAQGTVVDAGGRRGVTEFQDSIEDSQVSRRWCVAEGDPLGRYRIRAFWGSRELADLEFEMVADDR